MNEEKWKLFLEVARTLNCRGATPLLYGSLGLWHRTGEAIFADDIDVLLPETWLSEQWSAFQTLLQAEDWRLIDAHEHTFEKRGVHCSFAALEELETFAGVPISEIETRAESGAKYRLRKTVPRRLQSLRKRRLPREHPRQKRRGENRAAGKIGVKKELSASSRGVPF